MKKMSEIGYGSILKDIASNNKNEIEDIVYIDGDISLEKKCDYGIVFLWNSFWRSFDDSSSCR